tara:strand:- start:3475 stop:3618 length:144 start_codon:yes stop_codon:yes gene_type:complete
MNEELKKKLTEVCDIVNGTWQRQSLLNSRGESSERIVISYPSTNNDN